MAEHSSLHPFLDWMKQRIDEMDATVASLEAKAGQLKADPGPKATQLLADLKNRRAEFQTKARTQLETAEAALKTGKVQLETQWQGFEAQVQAYLQNLDKRAGQHQATFRQVAAAHIKAWTEAQDRLQAEAAKLAGAQRVKMEAVLNQMKMHASEAEARLEKLKHRGDESWAALSAALSESRKAFDRASQEAWEALKKAASR